MTDFILKRNQKQLNKLKPDFIIRQGGFSFYECPVFGDESPMLVKSGDTWFQSNIWEIDDIKDALESGVNFPL
jgi:hypothetical protein